VGINNVDSEHTSAWEEFGEPPGYLTRATSCIEDAGLGWKGIAMNQRDFLRPDSPRLRIQTSHHRLVGHLLRLRVEIGHSFLLP
jgi:hypothetical protein